MNSCVKHQAVVGFQSLLSCFFEVLEPGAASHNLGVVVFDCTVLHISMTINKHQLSFFPEATSHNLLAKLTASYSAQGFNNGRTEKTPVDLRVLYGKFTLHMTQCNLFHFILMYAETVYVQVKLTMLYDCILAIGLLVADRNKSFLKFNPL